MSTPSLRRRRVRALLPFSLLAGVFAVSACDDGPLTPVDPADCALGAVQALEVGSVLQGSVGAGTRLCLESVQGAEYALMPYVGQTRDTLLSASLLIESRDFLTDTAPFTASGTGMGSVTHEAAPSDRASARVQTEGVLLRNMQAATVRFHERLRERERSLLGRRTPALERSASAAPARSAPPEGALLELSVSAICDEPEPRTGRVVAVTERAIVVTDQANPPGGFSDETLRGFGQEFDDLAHPLVVGTFGEPTDLDGNGRIILFFTSGVNDKTPAGGTGIVAGYFWGGDLFSRSEGASPCPSSNEGEVLYLAVPDARVPERSLGPVTINTAGHELQHLINASRRIHVNDASRLEDSWLNEGLSFIAEELLFYEATGLGPGANLSAPSILQAGPATDEAFTRFAEGNVYRYNLYLQSTRSSSPIGMDGLQTRGASWSFLRYAADRDPGPDRELFRALTDTRSTGLGNLGSALGVDATDWLADWGVSVLADDLVPDIDARFTQPSWNMRALIPALRPTDSRFPLQVLALDRPGSFLIQLRPAGTTAHPSFRLPAGRSDITLRPDGFEGEIRYTLLRVR